MTRKCVLLSGSYDMLNNVFITVVTINMWVLFHNLPFGLWLTSFCRACRYAGGTFSYTSIMILLVRTVCTLQCCGRID